MIGGTWPGGELVRQGRRLGRPWGGIVKHSWWILILVILRVSLVCDYHHRVLVAEQGG